MADFFIGDINGRLWSADEWNNTAIPNGIVCKSNGKVYVMALRNVEGGKKISVDLKYNAPDMPKYTNANAAKLDFNGKENTTLMASFYGTDVSFAVGAALAYIFPNGENGYIPSVGELDLYLSNIDIIENLLSLCNGQSLLSSTIITSTRGVDFSNGQVSYWFWIKSNGWTNWAGIDGNFNVRAFSAYVITNEIPWGDGDGNLYVSYKGEGNDKVNIYSDINEDIDRIKSLNVSTVEGSNPKSINISVLQTGLREEYITTDNESYETADGKIYGCLKQ